MNKIYKNNSSEFLSRNVISSKYIINNILDSMDITEDIDIIDIESRHGIFAEEVAKRGNKIITLEKNKEQYDVLKELFSEKKEIILLHSDIFSYTPYGKKFVLFGIFSFNKTADIIHRITTLPNPPIASYITVQKDAGYKYIAHDKQTFVNMILFPWFSISIKRTFKETDFVPNTTVPVVLLCIKTREKPLVDEKHIKLYQDFISFLFLFYSSNLKKALKSIFTDNQISRLQKDIGFSVENTPTELNSKKYMSLFSYFVSGVDEDKKYVVKGWYSKYISMQKNIEKTHRTRHVYNKTKKILDKNSK